MDNHSRDKLGPRLSSDGFVNGVHRLFVVSDSTETTFVRVLPEVYIESK